MQVDRRSFNDPAGLAYAEAGDAYEGVVNGKARLNLIMTAISN
jgi:hypothetical protein